MEEDDDNREACGDEASASVLSQESFVQGKSQHNRKPVGREPLYGGAASTRSTIRKQSIDEVGDRFISCRFGEEGGFSGRPLFYSPPQSSLHVEDILLSNPRLPMSVPPFQHLVGGGVSVDLDSGQASTDSSLSDGEGTLSPDQTMSEFGGGPGILPEFIGTGGGTGIFGVPIRSAMHPDRPPALELRPHPLRETQAGCFLRTIVSSGSQLWAGLESGLRFWNLDELFECWNGQPAKRGDEESAPFYECDCTSPVLCLVADEATGLVWSGHKDGKVRSWRIPKQFSDGCLQEEGCGRFGANTVGAGFGDPGSVFREGLSWQAHRTAVLSMIITSYGDIWTGTEAGILKAWPWESIEKSLYLTIEERHMATVLVERSYVDLRSQITENGMCSLPAVDIRFLLCDHSRSTVWSAGGVTFTLWDSRKRELLKVFNIDGHVENQLDIAQTKEAQVEDEMKVRLTKKEKLGSMSFLKRSRNALMGAADVVRRVAQKGTFAEDNRRTEALVITMDGMIWTGLSNGSLVQWDGNGNRQWEVQHHFSAVMCLFAFGIHLWVGYADGTVQILDLAGFLIGGWVAHSGPIIKMDVGASYIFTLANHGGIRGWCLTSPGLIDDILRRELSNKELVCTKMEQLEILVGTWNVGKGRASCDSLISWLGSAATDVGLVVVGLQEVEMGAGSLAIAAAKETIGLEGSANGQWWLDTIGKILDEGTSFERIGSRQLAGLLIASWVRKSIRPSVGDVDAAAVACGFGRTIGNKGAVGLRMRVFERMLCFVNCHFAAHLDAVSKRNADFDHVYQNLTFTRPSMAPNSIAAGATSVQVSHGGNSATSQNDEKPELSEADMVVFLGDFNYRLFGISYDEARDMLSQRSFDWLREKDQLRAEMNAGRVFQGMREARFMFPPTYKFDKHQCGLSAYDSSEKKRIPAWCDRILYRDSRPNVEAECSLECPVVSSVKFYESCMDVTDSDHKPVRCIFGVEIAHIDRTIMRKQFGAIVSNQKMRSLFKEHCIVPETIVSTNNIILQSKDTSILRITNKCEKHIASYRVICEYQSTLKADGCPSEICTKGSFGFPSWLQVQPAAGIIKPGQVMEVKLHHDDFETHEEFVDGVPQNWWCVDNRDKEVVLLVEVTGSYSTETREHRIHVRHCCSKKESPGDTTWSSDRPPTIQNLLQRSDFANFSSSDVMNLNHMSCP